MVVSPPSALKTRWPSVLATLAPPLPLCKLPLVPASRMRSNFVLSCHVISSTLLSSVLRIMHVAGSAQWIVKVCSPVKGASL